MDHGGVTEAAHALGLTQSAVSKHLSKLRETYGDPLFVRTPDGMRPTPRATWMSAHVSTILAEAEALSDARLFQPKTLDGMLTISTTDEVCNTLLARLVPRLTEQAPGVRPTFVPLSPDYSEHDLESGRVDLVISVNWHSPGGLKQNLLFNDHFVCVASSEHSFAKGGFSMKEYADAEHILVAPLGMREGRIDEALARYDLRRVIRLSVPLFLQLTPEVLGKNYIATVPSRVAKDLCQRNPDVLTILDLPLEVPEISYFSLWHTRFDKDPRHIWLRGLVRDAFGRTS